MPDVIRASHVAQHLSNEKGVTCPHCGAWGVVGKTHLRAFFLAISMVSCYHCRYEWIDEDSGQPKS